MTNRSDNPNRVDQMWLATVARIDIPLRSVVNLRRVASELRGLADRLDWLSRDFGETADILYRAKTACNHTRRNIEKIRTPGRPRKRVHSTRWLDTTSSE